MLNENQPEIEGHPWITEPTGRIELNPLDAKAFYNRAVGYSNFKQTEKAIGDYTSAININPKYKEAYEGRAYAYEAAGEAEKAAEDRRRAAELGELPTRRFIAELTGKIEAAPHDPQTANLYRTRGALYAQLHEFEPAISDYTRAVELQPDYTDAYYERSQIYSRLSRTEDVLADYIRLLEINPDNAFIRSQRAGLFLNLKQYEKAINDYTRIIAIDAANYSAFSNRAIAYAATGEDDKAAADSERAENIKAEAPLKEISKYTGLIESGADDPETLSWYFAERGSVYHSIGEYEKAISDYTRAIELQPDHEDSYFLRAKAYEAIGDTTKAAADRNRLM